MANCQIVGGCHGRLLFSEFSTADSTAGGQSMPLRKISTFSSGGGKMLGWDDQHAGVFIISALPLTLPATN